MTGSVTRPPLISSTTFTGPPAASRIVSVSFASVESIAASAPRSRQICRFSSDDAVATTVLAPQRFAS